MESKLNYYLAIFDCEECKKKIHGHMEGGKRYPELIGECIYCENENVIEYEEVFDKFSCEISSGFIHGDLMECDCCNNKMPKEYAVIGGYWEKDTLDSPGDFIEDGYYFCDKKCFDSHYENEKFSREYDYVED